MAKKKKMGIVFEIFRRIITITNEKPNEEANKTRTYVIKTLRKSKGQVELELSLQRIEMTRSSGKPSKKSNPPEAEISGDFLILFRQTNL